MEGGFLVDQETGEIIDEDEIDFDEFDDDEEGIPDEEYALPNHSLMDDLRLKSNIWILSEETDMNIVIYYRVACQSQLDLLRK